MRKVVDGVPFSLYSSSPSSSSCIACLNAGPRTFGNCHRRASTPDPFSFCGGAEDVLPAGEWPPFARPDVPRPAPPVRGFPVRPRTYAFWTRGGCCTRGRGLSSAVLEAPLVFGPVVVEKPTIPIADPAPAPADICPSPPANSGTSSSSSTQSLSSPIAELCRVPELNTSRMSGGGEITRTSTGRCVLRFCHPGGSVPQLFFHDVRPIELALWGLVNGVRRFCAINVPAPRRGVPSSECREE